SPAIARAAPVATGVATLLAGALQFTRWKARQLACCRHCLGGGSQPRDRARAAAAVYAGLRLGLRCSSCCAGLTTVLLATGVMDLRAMAAVTLAITIERLAPTGSPAAHAIGLVFVVAGLAALNSAV
ncbi:MAG: DUF2182 domain-containing protein, partial [Proteobacteria bacterium]|nr:DUF2182 domain-containing protein [Pseudomonadota bacterium]